MISLKCKSCGDLIYVGSNDASVVCPSCGNVYEVPLDEKKEQYLNLYSRADDAWDHKDFEEASELYQQILNSDNTQAEAHFGLVLCKYGITYEIDPVTQKKMPTCNRINRDSILDDKHFQSAVKYASKEAATSFQRRAQEIERISRDFLKIVDKEPPYDVFISYKRTATDGSITQDSKVARKLYFHLKEKGFKIFFAEETLKSIAGEKYEPYIFAALSSAPVMILVGSTRDHFEATWVKNEWRRYLALMNQGLKKTLIPAYFDMDPYNMPGELRSLQAMNAADFTFHEDITEIIRKKVADAKSGQINTEVQGQSLREKYATKDKVDKLVEATDCDREFAINVLVQCHGDFKQSQQYIEEDPGYKKSLWICAECHANNTHDKCHHCGISKKESVEVARARKEMEERAKKKSAEYRRQKAETTKKVLTPIIVIAVLAILAVFVVWPKMIYPNMANDDFNTPEIVQTYCGSVDRDSSRYNEEIYNYIFTISSCDGNGNLQATCEWIHEKDYGKYTLTGKITEKKNNGNIKIDFVANQWEFQPEGETWFECLNVEITDNFTKFSSNEITLYSGTNDEFEIKTAADLRKLSGSDEFYIIKNDIDLSEINWTPIDGFSGVLMGNGYSIKNLKIESSASNVGFFSTLDGTVMNLNFENAEVSVDGRTENIGILCGTLNGTALKVNVSGNVTAQKSSNVGGMVGNVGTLGSYSIANLTNKASVTGLSCVGGVIGRINNDIPNGCDSFVVTLKNLVNEGNVTAIENYAAGIVGHLFGKDSGFGGSVTSVITDCVNKGTISGNYYVGGILGYGECDTDSTIVNCKNQSTINANAYVGCIAGATRRFCISDSDNEGSVLQASGYSMEDGEKYAYVGGLVGKGTCLENCTNYIDINYNAGGKFVGGLMGYCNLGEAIRGVSLSSDTASANIKNLVNNGNVTGNSYVGGIMGGLMYYWENGCTKVTVTFEKLINSASIVAQGDFVAGLSGYVSGNVGGIGGGIDWCIYDSENSGNVSGNKNIGGLFGGFKNGEESGSAYASNVVLIEGCTSTGIVSGESNRGNIIGLDEIKK